MAEELKVVVVPITDITPHPENYRSHPEDQLVHLEASLERHGFYRPVVVSSDGYILAGHGIVEAATRLGYTEVPTLRVEHTHDSPEGKALLVADNETGQLAQDDDHLLVSLLKDLSDYDVLLGSGYDEAQFNALQALVAPPKTLSGFDPEAEWEDAGMEKHYDGTPNDYRLTLRFTTEAAREAFLERTPHIDRRAMTPRAWVATFVEQ